MIAPRKVQFEARKKEKSDHLIMLLERGNNDSFKKKEWKL